jgi:hypothetical protein
VLQDDVAVLCTLHRRMRMPAPQVRTRAAGRIAVARPCVLSFAMHSLRFGARGFAARGVGRRGIPRQKYQEQKLKL